MPVSIIARGASRPQSIDACSTLPACSTNILAKPPRTRDGSYSVCIDGAHVLATVDDCIDFSFSYPYLPDGMPLRVSDQGEDYGLSSNWGPEGGAMADRDGLATRHAKAPFQYLEVNTLPGGAGIRLTL